MTKEVAEKIVRGITDKIECNTVDIDDWAEFWDFTREEYEEFLDMAIKALEQQSSYNSVKSELKPCDDCISREDALKAIEEQKKGFYGVERYAIDECHSAVMKLPSVRPYREIVEDKRACEKCIHYVTRDSGGVVLCGCDSWECDFEEVKT